MKEIYKDIPNYEGFYQVSNLGNVKSLERTVKYWRGKRTIKEKALKSAREGNGYLFVSLSKNNKSRSIKIHKLVASAFLGHTSKGYNGLIVDHIDNNKLNNKLENLQLITARENCSKDKKGSSKYTGVSWNKHRNKWIAHITINNKQKHLGYFTDELEASKTYQKALKNHLKNI